MTLEAFIILLTVCAVITALFTEVVKEFLDSINVMYASNIVVLAVAMVVGCAGTMMYYWIFLIPINGLNCIMAILLGLANWVGAMLGYDKVMQAIEQIKAIKGV